MPSSLMPERPETLYYARLPPRRSLSAGTRSHGVQAPRLALARTPALHTSDFFFCSPMRRLEELAPVSSKELMVMLCVDTDTVGPIESRPNVKSYPAEKYAEAFAPPAWALAVRV